MCGIAGILGCGDRLALARMTRIMVHRGPDGEGMLWWDQNCAGLGHRRLAIIDVSESGGHQPMSDATGARWITFNGEIYNYRELREELIQKGHCFRTESDTEVLLTAYQEWGPNCLDRLNGMFAFAIYEPASGRLFAARDRHGVKPFYYHWRPGVFIFASEIKAILASGLAPRRPDFCALRTPTRFQLSPETGFEEIRKLPPGHCLSYEGKQEPAVRCYWALHPSEQEGDERSLIDQLDQLLEDSVRMQMVADVPVGIMLSGGLDSSLIAAYARKLNPEKLRSFTIRFAKEDQKYEQMPDDSHYARMMADKYGFEHYEHTAQSDIDDLFCRMVWHLDEPLADSATINTFILSDEARRSGIKVLLNGIAGDEVFGGYRKQKACVYADYYQQTPRFLKWILETSMAAVPVASAKQGYRNIRWIKRFLSFANLPKYDRYLASDQSYSEKQYREAFLGAPDYKATPFYNRQKGCFMDENLSYLTAMCWNDTNVFLPEHNLLYSDKASMAASVEGRPPLTDHRLTEFMFRLPPKFRISRGIQKYAMKKVAERHLPKAIIYRPKAPFTAPLRSWIRGELSHKVDEMLSESSLRKRGLYHPEFVADLIAADRSGAEDNAFWIWQLLTVELWFRTFFDSAFPEPDIRPISWNPRDGGLLEARWRKPVSNGSRS